MNINEKIISLMQRHGLSQQALAELIGVSQASVSDWCKDSKPRPQAIQRLSEVLNISTDYLVDDKLDLPDWVAPLKVQLHHEKPLPENPFTKREIKALKGHIDSIIKSLSGVSKILDSADKQGKSG
jgi:transcriptional regulator with XRE-family HTH domain